MENKLSSKQKQVIDFVNRYPELFDDDEQKKLLRHMGIDVYKGKLIPDLIREVYDKLNILDDEDNIYLGFIDLLNNNFNIENKNIVEVGGGIFPCLARKIADIQTTGTIRVYDPRLSIYEEDSSNLKLVREKFTNSTDVSNKDLLIGFMPCEATYYIIESAAKNNIDFMIALCEGGPHGDIYDYFESDNDWLNTILYMAEVHVADHNMGTLEKAYLKKYNNPYPVIYNKRKV